MSNISLLVNGKNYSVDVDPATYRAERGSTYGRWRAGDRGRCGGRYECDLQSYGQACQTIAN